MAARTDIPALAPAVGYGDRPRKLLPDRAMVAALEKGSKGNKGAPIPYADARAAPWYDTDEWAKHDAKGETQAPKAHLLVQYGDAAEDLGFGSGGPDMVARSAWLAASKAAKMKIRAAPWTASAGRIPRALAVCGSLGPDGFSLANNYIAVLAEMAAIHSHEFAIGCNDHLRYHIAREALTAEQAAAYLRAPADDRVNAQL